MDPRCISSYTDKALISSVAFCTDDTSFVTGGIDKCIRLHQVEKSTREIKYKCESAVRCVALAPNGKCMFGGDENGKIWMKALSVSQQKEDADSFVAHFKAINSIAFSPDGTRYTTASNDGTAKIFEYPTNNFVASFKGHTHWVLSSEFSPDSNVIVTAGEDKTCRIWDVLNKEKPRVFGKFPASVTHATFHPSGTIVGVALADGSFLLIDVRNEKTIQYYPKAHNGPITALRFHPSGSFALTSSTDKTLSIWDLIEGLKFYTIDGFADEVVDCKWSSNGSKFIACTKSGEVKTFSTNFDKLIKTIENTTSTAGSAGDSRIDEATGVMNPELKRGHPPKKESKPKQEDMTPEERDAKITAALTKMLNQVEILTKSAAMMTERVNMQAKTVERLQAAHNQ